MRKRRKLLLLLGCLVPLAAVCVWLLGPVSWEPQPSYGGKPLSEWVIGLHGEYTVEQAAALDTIGTNAVPLLLKWLRYDTPKWKRACCPVWNRVRQVFNMPRAVDRRQILAEEAALAVSRYHAAMPQVVAECKRLSENPKTSPSVRHRAQWLLFVFEDMPGQPRSRARAPQPDGEGVNP